MTKGFILFRCLKNIVIIFFFSWSTASIQPGTTAPSSVGLKTASGTRQNLASFISYLLVSKWRHVFCASEEFLHQIIMDWGGGRGLTLQLCCVAAAIISRLTTKKMTINSAFYCVISVLSSALETNGQPPINFS